MNLMTYDMEQVSSDFSSRRYDFLILAPNIEERSRTFFQTTKDIIFVDKVVIADYDNFHVELDKEQEKSILNGFDEYDCYIIKSANDKDFLKGIKNIGITSESIVGVDITGFSTPSIYGIMNMLKNICKVRKLDAFYTEPKFYVYEEGYFDSYHRNIKERICAPIAGYINNGKDQREVLTIFLGFDGGLADLVYNKLGEEGKEIIRTLVVNGFPSYTAKLKDVSLFNNEGLITKLDKDDLLSTTANNPFDTYNLLCRVKKKYEGTLLNLCTIGSKPMALGTCMFALDYKQNVKVTYPFYNKTKFDADEQAGKIWRYGINFE